MLVALSRIGFTTTVTDVVMISPYRFVSWILIIEVPATSPFTVKVFSSVVDFVTETLLSDKYTTLPLL